MSYIMESINLTKYFSKRPVVYNVSIKVEKGDIYGFIGENGAGKTTVMRMICGLAAPSSGEIKLFGSTDLVSQRVKMGSTIETPALHPNMTALENMETQRLMLGIKNRNVCMELLELADIASTGKKKAKDFSLGMKQRLMIALSLIGEPEFLVLDEPTNGLDPMGIKEVRVFLQMLNKTKGITIFVSSHILGELEKICTRYGVISSGKMVDEFCVSELANRCGKNLIIGATDLQKAENIIKEAFPNASYSHTPEKTIRIIGHVEDAGHINTLLVNAGVVVTALITEGESLESHFLRLMAGGKANA